jgi:hypothetical protein
MCEEQGEASWINSPIPLTFGIRPCILIGATAASIARTVVETPFEYAKVRQQTGGSVVSQQGMFSVAQVREMYTGTMGTFWSR